MTEPDGFNVLLKAGPDTTARMLAAASLPADATEDQMLTAWAPASTALRDDFASGAVSTDGAMKRLIDIVRLLELESVVDEVRHDVVVEREFEEAAGGGNRHTTPVVRLLGMHH